MPSHKDLLKLIRDGSPPEEIHRRMAMRPSHWRRMIAGKRFQDALRTQESLAAVLAVHRMASGVHDAAGRLAELLESENAETVRKVCLTLLNEGLQSAPGRRAADGGESQPATSPAQPRPKPNPNPKPWELLQPLDAPNRQENNQPAADADTEE